MRGHIRQRGKKSWSIVLDLGRDASGKRKQKWHTVRGTKKDAERELARLLHEMDTGAYVEPSRMTVGEYLTKWLQDYAKVNVSAKTFERYAQIVRNDLTPALGGHLLSKLRPLHIQAYYSEALQAGRKDGKGGLSPQTVLHHHRLLRKALQQAVIWQMLPRNPADAVEPPRPKRHEMRALDPSEVARLLEVAQDTRVYIPVLLAVTTGMRRGEILALRWRDVDLKQGTVAIRQSLEEASGKVAFKTPKTQKGRRVVALPPLMGEALRRHRADQAQHRLVMGSAYQDNDLVCPAPDGRPWKPSLFTNSVKAVFRRAGLADVRFHDLRHTHATELLRQGVHPKIVSERLGHATISITLDTYSHVLPGMQEEAARRLDSALRTALHRHHQGQ